MTWIQDSVKQIETAVGNGVENGKIDWKLILIAAGVIIAAYLIMKKGKK